MDLVQTPIIEYNFTIINTTRTFAFEIGIRILNEDRKHDFGNKILMGIDLIS